MLLAHCPNYVAADFLKNVNVVGDSIEKVEMFCYLEYILCTEVGVQEAVTARIKAGWKKFKDVASVLCKKGLLVNKGTYL